MSGFPVVVVVDVVGASVVEVDVVVGAEVVVVVGAVVVVVEVVVEAEVVVVGAEVVVVLDPDWQLATSGRLQVPSSASKCKPSGQCRRKTWFPAQT